MTELAEEIKSFEEKKSKLDIHNTFDYVPLFGDFSSDEENFPSLQIDFNDSDCSEELNHGPKNEIKKNRRKASIPQRAIQADLTPETVQNGSIVNSPESSQDGSITDPVKVNLTLTEEERLEKFTDKFENLPENLFDLENGDILDPFNDDDIFKDLQDDTDGEPPESDIIENVKEEWRAHWGIKCNMCESVFPLKAEFDKHYQTNYSLFPVYTCTFCNKSFEKYSTFRSHCYRHITEGRYKCKECPKGFSLQSLLHVHVLAKHSRAKPFMCEECGRNFVTKPGLKVHLKKHKTEIKEDYPCVECGKVLHTRGGLTSHMNVHRLGRRFMCDLCGKTFTQKVNLQQHVKQHTGDKPHVCSKCDKAFSEKSHLIRHYSYHSNERPFKCTVCEKMYKTERCLKVHSLVHAAERPFVCENCNKGFLSSTKLKQHYNIHTGERPYKCKYCVKTFTNYPNWMKHIRRRHKVDHKTGALLDPLELDKLKKKVSKTNREIKIKLEQSKEEVTQESKLDLKVEPPTPTPVAFDSSLSSHTADILDVISTSDINSPPENGNSVNDYMLNDLNMTKAEEILLQHGFLNIPLLDDKFVVNQQFDLLGVHPNTTVGTNYFGPYFQTSIPGQTIIQSASPNIIPFPLNINDLITTNIVQQTLE